MCCLVANERKIWPGLKGTISLAAFVLASLLIALSPARAETLPVIGNQIKISCCPEAYVGRLYVNNLVTNSNNSVNSAVKIVEVGKTALPGWLVQTQITHELRGVPLSDDEGEYQMVVTVVNDQRALSTQRFIITVPPPPKTQCKQCTFGPLITIATVAIAADYNSLNASERVRMFIEVSKAFEISAVNITVNVTTDEPRNGALHICNRTLIERGLGINTTSTKLTAFSWIVDSDTTRSNFTLLSEKARNETVKGSLGFSISEWHLMSGNLVLNCTDLPQEQTVETTLLSTLISQSVFFYSTTAVRKTSVQRNGFSAELATSLIQPSRTMALASTLNICNIDTSPTVSKKLTSVENVSETYGSDPSKLPTTRSVLPSYSKYYQVSKNTHSTVTGGANKDIVSLSKSSVASDQVLFTAHANHKPTTNSSFITDDLLAPTSELKILATLQSSSIAQSRITKESTSVRIVSETTTSVSNILRTTHLSLPSYSRNFQVTSKIITKVHSSVTGGFGTEMLASSHSTVAHNQVLSTAQSASTSYKAPTSKLNMVSTLQSLSRAQSTFTSSTAPKALNNISSILTNSCVALQYEIPMPEFKLHSVKEKTFGPCAVNKNNPPIVNYSLNPMNISLCGEFYFQIPSDVFYDEIDGGTRNLSLKLVDLDGKNLSKDSWVKFDGQQNSIYGVPYLEVFKKQPIQGYQYLLVAIDSGGLTQNTTITIRIWGNSSFNHKIEAVIMNYAFQTADTVDILMSIMRKIANYFGNEEISMLQVLTFSKSRKVHSSKLLLSWTNCSLEFFPCDFSLVEHIRGRVTIQDTLVNPNFIRSLAPQFIVEKINFVKLGPCLNTRPQPANNELLMLNASFCKLFNNLIPENLFYDKESGNTRSLSLSITSKYNNKLPLNSWIQLNQTSQALYGILSPDVIGEQPIGGYRYYLSATDDGHLDAKTLIGVSVVNQPPQVNFMITLIFESYFDTRQPYVDEQLLLIKKVSEFLGNDANEFNVISFIRGNGYPSLNIFKWSNCSFENFSRRRKRATDSQCNFAHIEWLLKNLKLSNGEINPQLKTALLPTFVLKDAIDERSGPCLKSPNNSPRSQRAVLKLNISMDQWNFKYLIPNDTFIDKEDGFTHSLLLSLQENDSKPLSKHSWIQFNSVRQEAYGLVSLSVVQNKPKEGYKYKLKATDSGGKHAEVEFVIYIQNMTHHVNLVFQMVAKSYIPSKSPDVNHALELGTKLLRYLNSNGFQNIIPISFNRTGGFPSIILLVWTTTSFMGDTCNLTAMQHLVFSLEASKNVPKVEVARAVLPEFQLREVSHHKSGNCVVTFNNAPVLRRPLPPLKTSICETFKFYIPEDTFYDIEDGTTKNISLQLLDHHGKNVGFSSWVQLNSSSQIIFGLPLYQIQGRNVSTHDEFLLVATDREGAKINASINVSIFDPIPFTNYMIKLNFLSYTKTNGPDIVLLQTFLEKMKLYLQTSKSTSYKVKVISYNASGSFPKKVSLVWSSCMIDYKSCDYQKIQETWSKLSMRNGLVHPNFIRKMAPEFIIESVEEIKLGLCLNQPPKANRAIIIPDIGVCNLASYKIPKDIFIDPEDGDTRNLTLYLANASGDRTGKDSWCYLNDSSQVLYPLPTIHDVQAVNNKEIKFFLFARDKGGLSEKTELKILLNKSAPKLNYQISLALKVYYTSNFSDAFVLYNLRNRLENYLRNPKGDVYFISFTSGTNYPSMSLVSFSFCSLTQSSCDVATTNHYSYKINNPSLKLALLPTFEILSVFEKRLGPCSEDRNEPPRVKRPLNPLIINESYGMFTYRIPNNTFSDREDGSTKNLSLSLLKVDMEPVGLDSWIQIKTQTIYALPATTEYKNQPKDGYNFFLVATDSGKKFAVAHLQVYLRGDRVNSPMYQINISVKSFHLTETPTIFQIESLTKKLGEYIGNTRCPNKVWHVVDYKRSNTYPSILSAAVSTCTNNCDLAIVETVSSKLYTPKGSVLNGVKAAIAPFFFVEYVKLVRCSSSSQLVATFGRLFRVKVPEEVMSEMQARGHRNLTLRLQGPSSSPWLMLDNATNTLYGIPLFTNFEYQNGTLVNYTLFTVDQDGMRTEHIFKVFIKPGDFCSSTPSLVLTLNKSVDWFVQNPHTRVELIKKLIAYLGANESDVFVRSVQGTVRSSTNVVLVGIVNDTICGIFEASASVNALVTGMMTPEGEVRSTLLNALAPFGVLDVFSRLPTAIIPRPNLTGAKIVSGSQASAWGWLFLLFGVVAVLLLIVIGVWICCYYKRFLKRRGGILITEMTPKEKSHKYFVLEESENLVNSVEVDDKDLDATDHMVRVTTEGKMESISKTNTKESNSYEFYSSITKLKTDRKDHTNKEKQPSFVTEQPVKGEVAGESENFDKSHQSFDDDFVVSRFDRKDEENEDKEAYLPPVYGENAPTYFLPPLLCSRVTTDSGVLNAGDETELPPATGQTQTSPVHEPSPETPSIRKSPEYHYLEDPVKDSPEKQRKSSPKEELTYFKKHNIKRSQISNDAVEPSDIHVSTQDPLSVDEKEPDYAQIDGLPLPNPMFQQGPFRRSQRRQLPELPPVPPLHRLLSRSKERTNASPSSSPSTYTPSYSMGTPMVFHIPLELTPSTTRTTATINLGGIPMQVPLVLSRDQSGVFPSPRALQPGYTLTTPRDTPTRFTELGSRENLDDYTNQPEDISYNLTEDLDLGNTENTVRLVPRNSSDTDEVGRVRGYGEQRRDSQQRIDIDLGYDWTSQV